MEEAQADSPEGVRARRLEIVDGVGPVIDRPIREMTDLERLRPFDPSASVGPMLEAIGLTPDTIATEVLAALS